jgi:hypothetical protein
MLYSTMLIAPQNTIICKFQGNAEQSGTQWNKLTNYINKTGTVLQMSKNLIKK